MIEAIELAGEIRERWGAKVMASLLSLPSDEMLRTMRWLVAIPTRRRWWQR